MFDRRRGLCCARSWTGADGWLVFAAWGLVPASSVQRRCFASSSTSTSSTLAIFASVSQRRSPLGVAAVIAMGDSPSALCAIGGNERRYCGDGHARDGVGARCRRAWPCSLVRRFAPPMARKISSYTCPAFRPRSPTVRRRRGRGGSPPGVDAEHGGGSCRWRLPGHERAGGPLGVRSRTCRGAERLARDDLRRNGRRGKFEGSLESRP